MLRMKNWVASLPCLMMLVGCNLQEKAKAIESVLGVPVILNTSQGQCQDAELGSLLSQAKGMSKEALLKLRARFAGIRSININETQLTGSLHHRGWATYEGLDSDQLVSHHEIDVSGTEPEKVKISKTSDGDLVFDFQARAEFWQAKSHNLICGPLAGLSDVLRAIEEK